MNSLERLLTLSPNIDLLFEFDQHLFTASKCTFPEPDNELASEFLPYFKGQFYSHIAKQLLNREAEPHTQKWTDTTKKALPLLWLSCKTGSIDSKRFPNATEQKKKLLELYEIESNNRILQDAATFQTCENSSVEFAAIGLENKWKEEVYRALFENKVHLDGIGSSHLISQATLESTVCNVNSLENPEEASQDGKKVLKPLENPEEASQNGKKVLKRKAKVDDDAKHEPICSLCGNKYSSKSNLAAHIESAHKGKRYLCSQCPDIFTAAASLRRHASLIHPGLDVTIKPLLDEGELILTTDNSDQKIRKLETQYAHNEAKINALKEEINKMKQKQTSVRNKK